MLETSDVPAGVVNIVTGPRDTLAKVLAEHDDVDGVWYFGPREGGKVVEEVSAGNMKRTWVSYTHPRDWLDAARARARSSCARRPRSRISGCRPGSKVRYLLQERRSCMV